jgi:hypothetical protein
MVDKNGIYIKEYGIDSMKISWIVGTQKAAYIWFPSDGKNGVNI